MLNGSGIFHKRSQPPRLYFCRFEFLVSSHFALPSQISPAIVWRKPAMPKANPNIFQYHTFLPVEEGDDYL
jgi:hypothetical protein